MRLLDGRWHYTATDLVDALDCDLRTTLNHALAAGIVGAPTPTDTSDTLATTHGVAHEEALLDALRHQYDTGPGGVVEIDGPLRTRADIDAAVAATRAATQAGAAVIYQGVLADGFFYGRPDFLIRNDLAPFVTDPPPLDAEPTAGLVDTRGVGYSPYDAKLARHAAPSAVLQLAAYATAMGCLGVEIPEQMHLLLGDGTTHTLPVAEFTALTNHLHERLREKLAAPAMLPALLWAPPNPACGTCRFAGHCANQRDQARDLSLVAKIRGDAAAKLREAGIATIDELAAAPDAGKPARLPTDTFTTLRAQAQLQVAQDATRTTENPTGQVTYQVISGDHLAALPAPSPGDVYFDMEGDPYALGNTGLEYLFGAVTLDTPTTGTLDAEAPAPVETFTAFWAHDRAGEKEAFEQFIDFATARIAVDPGAHIYHYAPYEATALKRLCAVHSTREAEVDELLRGGRLVDLYAVVRKALRVSQRSYSIKYLEPLYMPTSRGGEVTTAASSIEAYESYLAAHAAGEADAAAAILDAIAEYNTYDCVSTHRLHRWLLGVRGEAGIGPAAGTDDATDTPEEVPSALAAAKQHRLDVAATLAGHAAAAPAGTSEATAAAVKLLAALVAYYDREANPAWWEFFSRIEAPLEDLEHDTDCYVPAGVHAGQWTPPEGRQRKWRRTSTLTRRPGALLPFRSGETVRGLYRAGATSAAFAVAIDDVTATTIEIVETTNAGELDRARLVALLPATPIAATPKDAAVCEYGERVAASWPTPQPDAILDLLARTGPRLTHGTRLPDPSAFPDGVVGATLAAVDVLDDSVLAIQGPPGAGKSYLARQLISHLVASGRSVGVCSGSHKAIENVLAPAAAALPGVPFAKRNASGPGPEDKPPWEAPATTKKLASWVSSQQGPFVVGGTAWHFAGLARDGVGVDVLIIDEAGQFALADTIAVAGAARNLVLLGDPQQLPQVTQGAHPDGADASALGHLLGGQPVIDARLGYFLDTSRRMHPEVCGPVSRLSYTGKLTSHPVAAGRSISGIEPGVSAVFVAHEHNTSASTEEAEVVTKLVGELVGSAFTDTAASLTRPLEPGDLMVVAPYNAQVRLLRDTLAAAGYGAVPVGTVDKFQGQEAPVVVVSMAASDVTSTSRGAQFLLSRNRMNVAVSRAQVAAYVVCSPGLHRAPVRTVEQLRLLAGLLTVTHAT